MKEERRKLGYEKVRLGERKGYGEVLIDGNVECKA